MKTAIIMVGGGMKSAHGGGFLYAMHHTLQLPLPDIMIGSSGDAGNVAYYAAGQYDSFWPIWTQHLPRREFVSFFRFWRVLDVDYLIDSVFKHQYPLDTEALSRSPIEWYIPITNYDTGETSYVSAADGLDIFETLRAAKAVPILFGKKIPLLHKRYIDGEIGPTIEDHVRFAMQKGASKILLINHNAQWNTVSKAVLNLYGELVPDQLEKAIERDTSTPITCVSLPNATIYYVMAGDVSKGTAIRSQKEMERICNKGAEDALAMREDLEQLFRVL